MIPPVHDCTRRARPGAGWGRRLSPAPSAVVPLQAGLYDVPEASAVPKGLEARHRAPGAGVAPSADTAFSMPPAEAAAAAAAPGIIHAWVESARATLGRGIANFSGFSLPAPSELLELMPHGPKSWPRGKGAVAAAVVDPDAAAALRRRVEGEIMVRSGSSTSLDKLPATGKPLRLEALPPPPPPAFAASTALTVLATSPRRRPCRA